MASTSAGRSLPPTAAPPLDAALGQPLGVPRPGGATSPTSSGKPGMRPAIRPGAADGAKPSYADQLQPGPHRPAPVSVPARAPAIQSERAWAAYHHQGQPRDCAQAQCAQGPRRAHVGLRLASVQRGQTGPATSSPTSACCPPRSQARATSPGCTLRSTASPGPVRASLSARGSKSMGGETLSNEPPTRLSRAGRVRRPSQSAVEPLRRHHKPKGNPRETQGRPKGDTKEQYCICSLSPLVQRRVSSGSAPGLPPSRHALTRAVTRDRRPNLQVRPVAPSPSRYRASGPPRCA